MKKRFLIALIISAVLLGCERDDICAAGTATTPRVIIEFYNVDNPLQLRSVPRLSVYGESLFINDTGEFVPPTEISDDIVSYNEQVLFDSNISEIGLPLRIGNEGDVISTRFVLERNTNARLDEDDTTDSNIDVIELAYIPNFKYVSRACGYKSIFEALSISLENDGELWINTIEVIETIVENETRVHVKIFH